MFTRMKFKYVVHRGRRLSKYDMAYLADSIHYCWAVCMYSSLSYLEMAHKLRQIICTYCPEELMHFENL